MIVYGYKAGIYIAVVTPVMMAFDYSDGNDVSVAALRGVLFSLIVAHPFFQRALWLPGRFRNDNGPR